MGEPLPDTELDVRDMLCAQALAQAAGAMARVPRGAALRVLYNAEDVRRDLIAWARDRHYAAQPDGDGALRLTGAPTA